MELLGYLRTQVHANRLANHRLHHAMRTLSREQFQAERTSFFPSLAKTLNHILAVDLYYLAALHGETDMERQWRDAPRCETVADLAFAQAAADLAFAQAAADQRFIDHVGGLEAAALDAVIDLDRG
ncbi:MAG: DinB family protein, partial [Caldimonas sp.]